MDKHCFVVLGMHRSATSLLAKGIFKAGVNIGSNVLSADSGNPHGYWEDTDFLYLNKWLLAEAGGNWYDVPSEEQILRIGNRADVKERIKKLVNAKYEKNNLWGFKDPRTILTIKVIRPYLKKHSFFVAFRDPVEIARSLYARNHKIGDMQQHIKVAAEYNRRLIKFLGEITATSGWSAA
jgi:hypothetical protein